MTLKNLKRHLRKPNSSVFVGSKLVDCDIDYVKVSKKELLESIKNLSNESKENLNCYYHEGNNAIYFD